jgi:hypothetical protein
MKALVRRKWDQRDKDLLVAKLTEFLSRKESVLFAYLHGSFLKEKFFRDIDVAVYLDSKHFKYAGHMFDYCLSLAAECDLTIPGNPIDIKFLNATPLPFRFEVVTRGQLLFTRDEEAHIDFVVRTRSLYFDFLPHLKFYFQAIVLEKHND